MWSTGHGLGSSSLMAMKTIICLSFIVLNNFFANMCVKKNCASPTKSLTARHWLCHVTKGGNGASPPSEKIYLNFANTKQRRISSISFISENCEFKKAGNDFDTCSYFDTKRGNLSWVRNIQNPSLSGGSSSCDCSYSRSSRKATNLSY